MAKKTDEVDEETKSAATSSESSMAHRALFSAVENSLDGDGQDEKKEFDVSYSCKPLNRLFHPSTRSGTLVPGHSPKQQQKLLLETIQGFNKGHARRVFQGLKALVEAITTSEAYIPESAFHADGEEHDENVVPITEITPDKESTEVLHFLQHVTMCIDAYLQGQIERSQKVKRATLSRTPSLSIVAEVYGVALDLHNLLFSLQACGPEGLVTQSAILGLCESWWHANALQRENMILQCLPLLVLQALDGKNFQKSHIKRIFQLKEAFHIIDFTNPASDSLRSLLLRLASNPLCLRMPEGIRFLASLFQEPSLVADLHLAVRAQIPEAKDTVLKAYGEIYLKAWKDSADVSEECREAIENEALQDFVHAVIHMASSATAKSILKLLEPFHSKKTPDVEGLLYRLYSPIIWRSLGSANSQVRVNSIVALGQVFPLQDASRTQTQAAIAKGTEALKNVLQDSDHRVRVAGSETTAQICVMFWDVLPAKNIRMLLNRKFPRCLCCNNGLVPYVSLSTSLLILLDIVMEHASDASSSDVRAGALDAITTLLESPQSRAVLRPLLPSLGNLIHDKAQRVRLAAIRMLTGVKRIPGIRFYHVVPVDHLLARLAEEGRIHSSRCNGVAKELTALLLNSYFPQGPNVTGTDQLKRTLTFLLTQPSAAAVFYSNLASHLSVESVAKLIVMLLKCLNSAVKADQAKQIKQSKIRKKRRRHGADDDEDDETDDQTLNAANTPLMADLAETICTLWESIAPQLRTTKHEDCNDLLSQSLSEVELTNMLVHFEEKATESASKKDETSSVCDDCSRTCTAILRCAGQLSLEAVDGILPHIIASLSSLSDNEGNHVDSLQQHHVSAHIALLCMWGMTDEVVKSLSASIESGSEDVVIMGSPLMFGEHASTTKTCRRSGGRSSIRGRASGKIVIPTMPTRIAWGVVQDILRGADPSNVETRKSILSSPGATKVMEAALERGISVAEQMLLADSVSTRFGFRRG
jgi:condensin-2 complex subunit G2